MNAKQDSTDVNAPQPMREFGWLFPFGVAAATALWLYVFLCL